MIRNSSDEFKPEPNKNLELTITNPFAADDLNIARDNESDILIIDDKGVDDMFNDQLHKNRGNVSYSD